MVRSPVVAAASPGAPASPRSRSPVPVTELPTTTTAATDRLSPPSDTSSMPQTEVSHHGSVRSTSDTVLKSYSTLTVSHININSITSDNKTDELCQFIADNDVKILGLTETKLDSSVDPSLYNIRGFHTPLTKHRSRHGGGVALYIHSSLPAQQMHHIEVGNEEWIWAMIKTKQFTLIVCCLYLPPNQTSNKLHNFINNLTEAIHQSHRYLPTAILILGDFNAGNVYLSEQLQNSCSGSTSFDYLLKDTTDILGMHQLISEPTRISTNSANLRDLIFTSNPEIVIYCGTKSPFAKLDHFPIIATLNLTPPPQNAIITTEIWDYRNTDTQRLTNLLMDTNWDTILDNDIETATTQLINAIHDAATASIPIMRKKRNARKSPWVTVELKRNIRKRERLFKIAKHNPTEYNWDRWRYQRNLVTSLNRFLKSTYMRTEVNKLLDQKPNPKQYHQTLQKLIGRTRSDELPPLEGPDGVITSNDYEKATLLNNYFASQSTLSIPESHQPPGILDTSVPTLETISTDEFEVLKLLNGLDSNKSTGPDKIPVKLLKMTALIIAKPLSILFNKSLASGIFPSTFKEAQIKPIFKKQGSPSDSTCYRPISILSSISKVFEKIVYRNIYAHLSENALLTEKQSGYRQHHGTELQLLYLTQNIYKSLDTGHHFTAIYLDITKYFDKIWHKGLLFKCKNEFGITGILLTWLESYLKDRKQCVRINDTFSDYKIINAGCPQGSVLGPLLALIYLDGLSKRTQNDILFFADDTSLYAPYKTSDLLTTQLRLQDDLDSIYEYGQEWAITFNAAKTVQQTFSHSRHCQVPHLKFGGQAIPSHDRHKHLGLTFSRDLRFHEHINEICKKVTQTLSPLYPIAQYLPRPILDQVYKTYIRPHFDYCDIIYDGHITVHDATRLETLQNRAARLTTGALFRTSTDKLRQELGWEKLSTRRQIHRLSLYHKLSLPESNLPKYIKDMIPLTRQQNTDKTLRNALTHTQERPHTSCYQRSFFVKTNKQYNQIPPTSKTLSSSAFKKHLVEHFGLPSPPEFYTLGSKRGNTLHLRLRNEMSQLNSHLFQVQFTDSPACPCGFGVESIRHFIFSCSLYRNQRTLLLQQLTETLDYDIQQKPISTIQGILLHGTNLDSGQRLSVARSFQAFLINSHRFDA